MTVFDNVWLVRADRCATVKAPTAAPEVGRRAQARLVETKAKRARAVMQIGAELSGEPLPLDELTGQKQESSALGGGGPFAHTETKIGARRALALQPDEVAVQTAVHTRRGVERVLRVVWRGHADACASGGPRECRRGRGPRGCGGRGGALPGGVCIARLQHAAVPGASRVPSPVRAYASSAYGCAHETAGAEPL